MKTTAQGHGIKASEVVSRWFTDVSGLGLAEQVRRLMHPEPPRREEELARHVEFLQDKMRRLEAHGDEYKLEPVFKINTLKMLMTSKAKEYFDLGEGYRDTTDAAKSYEELLNMDKDYARRRKLNTTAQKNVQHGGDPMDVGAVYGYWDGNRDEEEIDTVGYDGH